MVGGRSREGGAYNPRMLESLQSLVAPAVVRRLTLLVNHVLSSEAVATQRLKPHAGRRVRLEVVDWPALLPAWPPLVFAVTPAGLLEWLEPIAPDASPAGLDAAVDLTLLLRAANPAQVLLQALAGRKPQVDVSGNAAFAADMSWLMDNLRWDIKDDLAHWLGQTPAHQLGRLGEGIAEAMRGLAQRWAPGGRPPNPPGPTHDPTQGPT